MVKGLVENDALIILFDLAVMKLAQSIDLLIYKNIYATPINCDLSLFTSKLRLMAYAMPTSGYCLSVFIVKIAYKGVFFEKYSKNTPLIVNLVFYVFL